jgi:hypothetical protein
MNIRPELLGTEGVYGGSKTRDLSRRVIPVKHALAYGFIKLFGGARQKLG